MNRVDHIVIPFKAIAAACRRTRDHGTHDNTSSAVVSDLIGRQIRPSPFVNNGNLWRKQGLDQGAGTCRAPQRQPDFRALIQVEDFMRKRMEEDEGFADVQLLPMGDVDDAAATLAEGDVHLVSQITEYGYFAVPTDAVAVMAAGQPLIPTATSVRSISRLAQQSGAFEIVPSLKAVELLATVQ